MMHARKGLPLGEVNPFRDVEGLYSEATLRTFLERAGKAPDPTQPHVFASAEEAYQRIRKDRRSQSIVVSGESGAGESVGRVTRVGSAGVSG